MDGAFGPVKYGTVNDPRMPIPVKVTAITIGTNAIGRITVTTTRGNEAPASRAASIMASGTACTPEVIINVANGNEVHTTPITTATVVKPQIGASTPNCAKSVRR